MPALGEVALREVLLGVDEVLDQLVIGRLELGRGHGRLLDGAEGLDHQHRVVGDDGPPRLGDDVRVRDLLVVADVGDVVDDVARVLVDGVVHRRVEGGARAVVVDGEAAAHVEVLDGVPHLPELGVVARRLAHRALDDQDVRHLRADVEVQQLEGRAHPRVLHDLRGDQDLRRGEAELGVLAPGLGPLARALGHEAHAQADHRIDAHVLGDAGDGPDLGELLGDEDDLLAELAPEQRGADEVVVLVAVADDERLVVGVHREAREDLGLAADLDAVVVGPPRIEDLLHHLAELVDLDREDAAVHAAELVLGDGLEEGLVEGAHPVVEQILEADQQRRLQALRHRVVHHLADVDLLPALLQRGDRDVPAFVHVEVPAAPAVDQVQLGGVLGRPA